MDMVADEGELNLRADRYDVCDDVRFGAELLLGNCEFLPRGLIQGLFVVDPQFNAPLVRCSACLS